MDQRPRPQVLAFLAAIKEHPEDDTRRLLLADWLGEHGGPADVARAEFVRLQCRCARLPAADPRRAGLQRREQELLARHREAWLGPLLRRAAGWRFERGLLALRAVARRCTGRVMAAVAASEEGAWVCSLRLQYLAAGAAARVAAAPLLAHLTVLELPYNRLGPRGVATVVSSPHLTRLTRLDLSGTGLGDEGAQALAAAPRLARLTALDLALNRIGAGGVAALAASDRLAGLGHLGLFGNDAGDRGAAALAASPVLARLTSLDLRRNGIGDAGAWALAASPHLTGLTALRVEDNRIGVEGEAALRQRFGARVRLVAGPPTW
jgi:uncharacterized protein (TIGR02996 family)